VVGDSSVGNLGQLFLKPIALLGIDGPWCLSFDSTSQLCVLLLEVAELLEQKYLAPSLCR
jgi:hypothetical protein